MTPVLSIPAAPQTSGISPALRPLTLLGRVGLVAFLLFVVAFGVLVEIRSAFLTRRMTDLDCFLRGAWAVRTGESLYGIVEENGWHYNYPPLFAIMMWPLADPPKDSGAVGYVPFAVSAGIVCIANLLLLALLAHFWASELENTAPDASLRTQPRYCRRWWALRVWPVLVCLPPIAQTVMRGQVNILILAALCLAAALRLRKKWAWSGATLSLAIAIKVIPIYLLVLPLWRREGRTLLGCLAGLALGLVVVPVAVMGPERTAESYREYANVFFGPLLGVSNDTSREQEILGVNATDSIGAKNVIHNWIYRDPATRPPAPLWIKAAYVAIGGGLTLLALLLRRRWRTLQNVAQEDWDSLQQDAVFFMLMAILSPICHLAYMMAALPLVAVLTARRFHGRDDIAPGWLLCSFSIVLFATNIIPSLPGLGQLKDLCLPMLGTLPILTLGIRSLSQPLSRLQSKAAPLSRAA